MRFVDIYIIDDNGVEIDKKRILVNTTDEATAVETGKRWAKHHLGDDIKVVVKMYHSRIA